MAGYRGYSMSNNAVSAYSNGLLPASKIKEVPAVLIERFVRYSEWHHSSKQYNRVKFYDPKIVRATFGLIEASDEDDDLIPANPEAVAALAAHKAEEKSVGSVHYDCLVEWIEWSGSLRNPKAEERKESGCTVQIKGQTAKITLPNGTVLTKRLSTRGFFWKQATQPAARRFPRTRGGGP